MHSELGRGGLLSIAVGWVLCNSEPKDTFLPGIHNLLLPSHIIAIRVGSKLLSTACWPSRWPKKKEQAFICYISLAVLAPD